jgi:hypothetical protein
MVERLALDDPFHTPDFDDMVRTDGQHEFASFIVAHITHTLLHIVESSQRFLPSKGGWMFKKYMLNYLF